MAYSTGGDVAGGVVRWKIEADGSSYYNEMNKVQQSAKSTAKEVNTIGESIKNLGIGALTAGSTALTGALSSLVKKGIQATDFLETSKNAMAGLTGSIAAGNKAMSIAANYWQNNPFQRLDVTNATKQLVQYGRNTNQLSKDLEILGNVSLSTGAQIDELAKYYARVSASGRAMTIDLEMMSDRGIPIYRELAKQLGTTQQGVREFASQGKISFEVFQKAMESAVDPTAMAEYENTLSRQIDRIKGSVQILAGSLAGYKIVNNQLVISSNGLEKSWTRLVKTLATELRSEKWQVAMEKIGNALAKIIDKVTEVIPLISDKLSNVIAFIGDHSSTLVPILGSVLAMFGGLASKVPMLGGMFGIFSGGLKGMNEQLVGAISQLGKFSTKLFSLGGPMQKLINLIPYGDEGFLAKMAGYLGRTFDNIAGSGSLLTKLSPIIAVVGLLGGALVSAYKNSEDFRNAVGSLFQALKKLGTVLMDSLRPILQIIVSGFKSIVSSKAITGILTAVVNALAWLTNVIASIPKETLTFLISFFLSLKMVNAHPILLAASAITMFIGAVDEMGGIGGFLQNLWKNFTDFFKGIANGIKNVGKWFAEGFGNVVSFVASIPRNLLTAGHNMMVGLANGVIEGAKKVYNVIKQVATNVVNTFKRVLQIHSPSRAMYYIGQYVTLGLAEGITDNESVIQLALDNLAKDILSLSEKIIGNQKDFGIINYNGEYKQWQKVANMFTKGSEQYNTAMEKMEEARKQVNLRIIQLQENYNSTLDETISKLKTMYSTFQKVDLTGGMDSTQIIKNLDQQVAQMEEWARSQEIIAGLELDPGFIKELQEMGVDATSELAAIANMTTSELATLNELWLKKQSIANREATRQMQSLKEDTLKEISELKKGIDGETVDVVEVGGRLVANIGEGVYGALPTLEDAFGQLDDYIAKAARQITSTASDTLSANSDYGDDALDVPNTTDSLQDGFDEINASIEGMSGSMINALLGVVAAVAAIKFGPKLLGAIFNKMNINEAGGFFNKTWDKLLSWFGKKSNVADGLDKSVGKVAEEMKNTSKATQTLSTASQEVGQGMATANQGLTKAQSVMKTIMMGAGAVILIAGAIAAMAGALWVTYNAMKDIDLEKLIADLAVMAGAVTAMGALAYAGEKLNISAKGILIIAGLAVDLGVMALAIRAAYELLKPVNWEDFGRVIGEVSIAIGALGVLAGVIGYFAPIEGFGVAIILGLAVDLAAIAVAIRAAYEVLKPVDWEGFGQVIGEVSATIGVLGVLAGVIGVFAPIEGLGVAIILGLALDLVAIAEAIRHADSVMPKNFDAFREKLGLMQETIGSMAVIGGVIGVFAPIEAMGVMAILALCEAMTKIASAIKYVNQNVPNNITMVKRKVDLLVDVVSYIASENLGNFFSNIGQAINAGSVTAIVDAYKNMAEALARLQEINLIPTAIYKNVNLIKDIIDTIGVKGENSIGMQIRRIVNNFLEAMGDMAVGAIVDTYKNIAENLNYIQGIDLNTEVILQKVGLIKDIVDKLGKTGEDSIWGQLRAVVNTFLESAKTTSVSSIVDTYTDIADKLDKIQNITLNKEAIDNAIDTLSKIVAKVAEPATSKGFWQQLKDTVKTAMQVGLTDSAAQILDIYSRTGGAITKIKDIPVDEAGVEDKINALNRVVQSIVDMKGDGGIFGAIGNFFTGNPITPEKVDDVLKILRKLGDVANTVNYIPGINTNALDSKVEALQKVIDKVGGIKDPGDLSNKEWIIGMTHSMLNKFTEVIPVINNFPTVRKERAIDNIQAVQDVIWKIGQINQSDKDNLTTKEWIIGMATSMAYKLAEFSRAVATITSADSSIISQVTNTMNALFDSVSGSLSDKAVVFERVGTDIGNHLAQGMRMQTPQVQEAGLQLQAAFWSAIQSKMNDEYEQGRWMATQFANGLNSMQAEISQAGQNAQHNYWQAIQNRMQDEYYQGRAMAERFRQGLYDLDYGNAGWWAVENFKRGAYNNDVYSAGYDRGYWFREAMYKIDYANAGWWAVQGFINGAYSRDVWSVGWQVANNFLNGMAYRGRQGSPWKTTFQSGSWAVEGLIAGIQSSETALVSEATTLADEVIDALTMDNLTMSPNLDVTTGGVAPSMEVDDSYGGTGRREVVIEQTNNNYTQYSLEQVNRDLAWELSKI